MIVVTLVAALGGAGLMLIGRGLRRPPLRLGSVVGRLNRPALAGPGSGLGGPAAGVPARLARSTQFARLQASVGASTARDLRMLGRPVERHVFDKLSCAVGLALMPPTIGKLADFAGAGLPGGMLLPSIGSLAGAVAGFVLPDVFARSQAATRRRSFVHALSSYLDLVNALLAGGAGVETALEAAADAGDGPSYAELRAALVRARSGRRSHWDVFAELGDSLGVDALTELAASMQLAGEQGARVRLSLAAKAAALRSRQSAEMEAAAQAASERMGLPVAAMFLGFLVFLGYPAVQQILGS